MMGRWRVILAVGVVALIGGGTVALLASHGPHYQPRSLPVVAPSVMSPAPAQASPRVAAAIARSAPVRVIIPSIGVNAPVIPEGTDSTGALEVPPLSGPQANDAGWWDGGAAPGQNGPAVIVGHINSAAAGNLVFAHLGSLKAGASVQVVLASGVTVSFTVTTLQEVSKDTFPTLQVYGPTAGPTIRLITCGGAFDPSSGHYQDNLIVYGTEVPVG